MSVPRVTDVEPVPGSHLAEVDCNVCGAYVYAVPDYADRAVCADCGRAAHGCAEPPRFPPFPRVQLSRQRRAGRPRRGRA